MSVSVALDENGYTVTLTGLSADQLCVLAALASDEAATLEEDLDEDVDLEEAVENGGDFAFWSRVSGQLTREAIVAADRERAS